MATQRLLATQVDTPASQGSFWKGACFFVFFFCVCVCMGMKLGQSESGPERRSKHDCGFADVSQLREKVHKVRKQELESCLHALDLVEEFAKSRPLDSQGVCVCVYIHTNMYISVRACVCVC